MNVKYLYCLTNHDDTILGIFNSFELAKEEFSKAVAYDYMKWYSILEVPLNVRDYYHETEFTVIRGDGHSNRKVHGSD